MNPHSRSMRLLQMALKDGDKSANSKQRAANNDTGKKRVSRKKPDHVRNLFMDSVSQHDDDGQPVQKKKKFNAFQPLIEGTNDENINNPEEDDLLSDVCSIFDKRYSPKKKIAIKNWVVTGNYESHSNVSPVLFPDSVDKKIVQEDKEDGSEDDDHENNEEDGNADEDSEFKDYEEEIVQNEKESTENQKELEQGEHPIDIQVEKENTSSMLDFIGDKEDKSRGSDVVNDNRIQEVCNTVINEIINEVINEVDGEQVNDSSKEVEVGMLEVDAEANVSGEDEQGRKGRKKGRKSAEEKKVGEQERKKEKKEKELKKHIFMSPCKCKQKKCGAKISEAERKQIYEIFWKQDYIDRRRWVSKHMEEIEIKKRYIESKGKKVEVAEEENQEMNEQSDNGSETSATDFKRQKTFIYKLPNIDGKQLPVCKSMFLRTLGFKSDKLLTTAIKSSVLGFDSGDKRGRHAPKHKLSDEDLIYIRNHIQSFNPCISHYRREHAPNRYYLPPELTAIEMHADYEDDCKKDDRRSVTYQRYAKEINAMNISFAKTGDERCEDCEEHKMHIKEFEKSTDTGKQHDTEEQADEDSDKLRKNFKRKKEEIQKRNSRKDKFCSDDNCAKCIAYREHRDNYILTRKTHANDKAESSKNKKSKQILHVSCDMQKVILLPRLPGFKLSLFTKRVVTINQTFAPLKGNDGTPVGILWHEAIMGRNDEDVASAYIKFMKVGEVRDYKEFVIWADNCTGQNKNWTLFTALVWFVNQKSGPQKVTIKYFVKGHTYMSADSFHKDVESAMKHEEKVCDWEDFTSCVIKHGKAVDMKIEDFYDFPNALSHGKTSKEEKPLLAHVYVAEFRKGSPKWFYKLSHADDEFREHDFLQNQRPKQFRERFLSGTCRFENKKIRGINEIKRQHIIEKLGPLMDDPKRTEFFINMQGNAELEDLCDTR